MTDRAVTALHPPHPPRTHPPPRTWKMHDTPEKPPPPPTWCSMTSTAPPTADRLMQYATSSQNLLRQKVPSSPGSYASSSSLSWGRRGAEGGRQGQGSSKSCGWVEG